MLTQFDFRNVSSNGSPNGLMKNEGGQRNSTMAYNILLFIVCSF